MHSAVRSRPSAFALALLQALAERCRDRVIDNPGLVLVPGDTDVASALRNLRERTAGAKAAVVTGQRTS